jgi:tol-pal system protein YbgF
MQLKFCTLLFILISSNIFADNLDSGHDQYAMDVMSKKIHDLVTRIEILEHKLSVLETKALYTDSKSIKNEEVTTINDQDIFDDILILNEPTDKQIVPIIADQTPNKESRPANIIHQDKQVYDLALAALKDQKFTIAENSFAAFLNNYPKSTLRSNAYFWHGETFFRRNIFDKAAICYLKGYKECPRGLKASDSLLKLAISLGALKNTTESCNILAKLEAEFPKRSVESIKRTRDAKLKFGCK